MPLQVGAPTAPVFADSLAISFTVACQNSFVLTPRHPSIQAALGVHAVVDPLGEPATRALVSGKTEDRVLSFHRDSLSTRAPFPTELGLNGQ